MSSEEELSCILLGQKWSLREQNIKDYGCNVFADKIALIDVILEKVQDSNTKKLLEDIRSILVKRGTALWIMKADPLTNLAIRIGKTRTVIDLGAKE